MEFQVTTSKKPQDWLYHATQSTRIQQGPKTARETLDPNCPAQYKNQILLTDLSVTACLAPDWWRYSAITSAYRLIPIGVLPIPAPEPADHAYQLTCIECPTSGTSYAGTQVQRIIICLGSHWLVAPDLQRAPEFLIAHIKSKVTKRLQGDQPSSFVIGHGVVFGTAMSIDPHTGKIVPAS